MIKATTRKIFFQERHLKTATQELAGEQALIHYYFKCREQILQTMFNEAVSETRPSIVTIFFRSALQKEIGLHLDAFIDYNIHTELHHKINQTK